MSMRAVTNVSGAVPLGGPKACQTFFGCKPKLPTTWVLAVLGIIGGVAVALSHIQGEQNAHANTASVQNEVTLVAPGRVEPISEEVQLSSPVSGQIAEIRVVEGQAVQARQVLAVLDNRNCRAEVAAAQAQVKLKIAAVERWQNGARPQERAEAAAAARECGAVLDNARANLNRCRGLSQQGVLSPSEIDGAEQQYRVAAARAEAAQQRQAILEAGPREEDLAAARAELTLAEAQLQDAKVRLDQTYIRSPMTGTVLRVHRHVGETVSAAADMPLFSVADVSARRVRIEVDESDIERLQVGQRVYVCAEAYGDRKFWGKVVQVAQVLGRKAFHTEEPTERVDTKVLEALVQLEPGAKPQLGLRVTAFVGSPENLHCP